MRKFFLHSFSSIGILFIMSTVCFSQPKPDTGKVKHQKSLNTAEVKAKFDDKNGDKGIQLRRLRTSMEGKGFKADDAYFGNETSFEQDGKTVTNSFIVQDYSKGNSKAAVANVSISDGTNQESYTFSLEKKGNNNTDVEEYYVNEKGEVVKAHSWYTCLRHKIASICGSYASFDRCWSAYTSWTSFLSCISGIACGINTGPKAIACCTCDCSWVCKWAVGCCDR